MHTASAETLLPRPGTGAVVGTTPGSSTVIVLTGQDVLQRLDDEQFVAAWNELAADCPWGTIFQSPAFARVWYRVYRASHEPLLVLAHGEIGELHAVFPLARNRTDRTVSHAGAHHAEYHCWLVRPEFADSLPPRLLGALAPAMNGRRLQLLFVPPGMPMRWLPVAKSFGIHVEVRQHRRGLMRVGSGSEIEASMRKSANKSRLARLKRVGAISFEELHTRAELETVIDTIAVQCDVRQGGVHASLPFRDDPAKRAFYLALMEEPGLSHAAVLRVGGEVIASHLSVRDPKMVPLGLVTHAAHFGVYSPGKLLLLSLGKLLGEQGYDVFDLTPGGSYKDRLATHSDEVSVIQICFGRGAHLRYRLRRRAVSMVRRLEHTLKVDVSSMANRGAGMVRRLRRIGARPVIGTLVRRVKWWVRSTREIRIYEWPGEFPAASGIDARVRINNLADLLLYKPYSASDPELTEFLRTAVRRLEKGQVLFTYAENGVLLHYSWVIPPTASGGSGFGHQIEFPDEPAVLTEDFTHPLACGRGLRQASLVTRLAYLGTSNCAARAVIGVSADNGPSRHSIEKVGFKLIASAWMAVRFGTRTRWLSGDVAPSHASRAE
jgi:CelD/BcsL family acetyltransferase involved in cellulose biosynthesis